MAIPTESSSSNVDTEKTEEGGISSGIESEFEAKTGLAIAERIKVGNEPVTDSKTVHETSLTVEQLYDALGKTFTTSDRKEILTRASLVSVNMTIEEVERTMGMGISSTHKGGQTITGKMQNGLEIEIRLPKSAAEVNEGEGWNGSGKAVEWNGISRILIIESN